MISLKPLINSLKKNVFFSYGIYLFFKENDVSREGIDVLPHVNGLIVLTNDALHPLIKCH